MSLFDDWWSEMLGLINWLIDLISRFEILKALKPLILIDIPKGLETLNLSLLKAWKIDLKNLHIEWELGC